MNQPSSKTMVIILAAGKGTRMNSNIPKVLHKINNKSMLDIVINTSKKITPEKIVIVVGYKKEQIIHSITDSNIVFVNQNKQLGTGHAIKQCIDEINDFNGNVLVLSGDVPLIKHETLSNLISFHQNKNAKATLISTSIENPEGYGRILKNNLGQLKSIVEHKDASKKEREIDEINSGIYIFESKTLCDNIKLIKNDNAQNEYYLPDIFNFIDVKNKYIYKINNHAEIAGVNTIQQLSDIEKVF